MIHIVRKNTPRFTRFPSLVLIRLVLTEIQRFKALAKRRRKLAQDLGQLATSFGQGLRALALTCDDVHSLWSRSNLHASRRKFFTVWPPNASLYASSNCVHLRLLAGPFGQGLKMSKLTKKCMASGRYVGQRPDGHTFLCKF